MTCAYQTADSMSSMFMKSVLSSRFCVYKGLDISKFYTTMGAPVETAIRQTLTENLQPVHLEVINESYMHNVPKGSETHFKVLVVSEKFDNVPLIKRHRMINDLIKKKLEGDFVHALSIEAKTPVQWNPTHKVEPSPKCLGGFGK